MNNQKESTVEDNSNKVEHRKDNKVEISTAAVIFVDNTKEGGLAREIREVLRRLEDILGYRVKVVERSGTPLKMMFPLTKIGEGQQCGRPDCITCTQDNKGDKLPPVQNVVSSMKTSAQDVILLSWRTRTTGKTRSCPHQPTLHPST